MSPEPKTDQIKYNTENGVLGTGALQVDFGKKRIPRRVIYLSFFEKQGRN